MKGSARLLLLLFVLAGCELDLRETVLHPSAEQRTRESLLMTPPRSVTVGDSYNFAVFADLHIGKPAGSYLAEFQQAVDSLNITFFCIAGDITEHGLRTEYDSAKVVLSRIAPFYTTIGNHDLYRADAWENFKTTFGPATYSVTLADRLKLIFFDTAEGRIGQPQFDWLERELADTTKIKILISHFPLYDDQTPGIFRLASTTERAKLQNLLQRYRVYAYCAGHIHGWRQIEISGVYHFTTGTISRALDFGKPGFLLFRVYPDTIIWQFITFHSS